MSDIAAMEQQITDLQELVEKKDLALKLKNNPEFKKLVLEGFCEKECARFARNSGDPALSEDERNTSLVMAQSAGHFLRWLSVTVRMGNSAESQIPELRAGISEMMQEGRE